MKPLRSLLLTLVALLLAASAEAQTTYRTTSYETTLFSFFDGDKASVVVSELSPGAAVSTVRIQIRNESGQVVASATGTLSRYQPVKLDFNVASSVQGPRRLLRASIQVTYVEGSGAAAGVVLERIREFDLVAEPKVSCAKPVGRQDPVFYCTGGGITATESLATQ
jgi:hypothetical protein